VFPLLCPICAGQMRIIAFITDSKEVCKILEHIGVDSTAPRIAPARGPQLWDVRDAPMAEEGDGEPEWHASTHAAPDDQVDQRMAAATLAPRVLCAMLLAGERDSARSV